MILILNFWNWYRKQKNNAQKCNHCYGGQLLIITLVCAWNKWAIRIKLWSLKCMTSSWTLLLLFRKSDISFNNITQVEFRRPAKVVEIFNIFSFFASNLLVVEFNIFEINELLLYFLKFYLISIIYIHIYFQFHIHMYTHTQCVYDRTYLYLI